MDQSDRRCPQCLPHAAPSGLAHLQEVPLQLPNVGTTSFGVRYSSSSSYGSGLGINYEKKHDGNIDLPSVFVGQSQIISKVM